MQLHNDQAICEAIKSMHLHYKAGHIEEASFSCL